jgi:hypothetical protein
MQTSKRKAKEIAADSASEEDSSQGNEATNIMPARSTHTHAHTHAVNPLLYSRMVRRGTPMKTPMMMR